MLNLWKPLGMLTRTYESLFSSLNSDLIWTLTRKVLLTLPQSVSLPSGNFYGLSPLLPNSISLSRTYLRKWQILVWPVCPNCWLKFGTCFPSNFGWKVCLLKTCMVSLSAVIYLTVFHSVELTRQISSNLVHISYS